MSAPITNVEPERLTSDERNLILVQIEDSKPARTSLLLSFAESVRSRREHDHPQWEDFYCLNLSSYMGERTGPVLRRLVDAEAENEELRARVAELEAERHSTNEALSDAAEALAELKAAPTAIYRAEHPDSGITLGHYGTEAAAREHCEAIERRSWLTGTTLAFDWIEDDEDGVAELVVTAGQNEESTTGYIVTALELASEYDEGADE